MASNDWFCTSDCDCASHTDWQSGLVSCGQWMMPMLWSGGWADKVSNKLSGDVVCLGGSIVEHQPRLLGCNFFRFCQKLHFQFPFPFLLSLSLFPSSSFPFPSPSDLSFALKKAFFAFIPLNILKKSTRSKKKLQKIQTWRASVHLWSVTDNLRMLLIEKKC